MSTRPCLLLACMLCLARIALAGPNAGGTLVLHDPDLIYTHDTPTWCATGAIPSSCETLDDQLDGSGPYLKKVWKVYALFTPGSSPRLKGITFGIQYPESDIVVDNFGPCIGDPDHGASEFPGSGWPGNDTGTALVFQHTQTATVVEVFWFAGYSLYGGPARFCLRTNPDPILGGQFGDDSIPSVLDPIAGFGCLGFDTEGTTACPAPGGACCVADGSCRLTSEEGCRPPDVWDGSPACDPNPCPQFPHGACCRWDGDCLYTVESYCQTGDWREGVACEPNPCPHPPLGACCWRGGHCEVRIEAYCPTGDWREGVPCDPNPCPQITGACCQPDGACTVTNRTDCATGDWREGATCDPNPCPQDSGACCDTDGRCVFTRQPNCPGGDWREHVPCSPNPCQPHSGACCDVGGNCVFTTHAGCPTGSWQPDVPCDPNPCTEPPGACCLTSGACVITTYDECPTGYWQAGLPCVPNPCPPSSGHCPNRFALQGAMPPPWRAAELGRGPNIGGTLLVHDAGLAYTTDEVDYCGQGAAPAACEYADVNLEGSDAEHPRIWKVYAAFMDGSGPRLKGLCWGIHYDPSSVVIVTCCNCCGDPSGGAAEFTGAGWPNSDTGTSLVFATTQTSSLVECYWFAGYNYAGAPGEFQLRDHPDPVLGGKFADDSIPSVLDPIAGYGSMGFEQEGHRPCPTGGHSTGACCIDWECRVTTEEECEGIWNGPGTLCDPNPCAPPPVTGACCIGDLCYVVYEVDCASQGGIYMGDDTTCDPSPCAGVPVERTTWGRVKSLYR